MKYFIDGDQVVITKDDFINLQESPAVFLDFQSEVAQTVVDNGVKNLPLGDLQAIKKLLDSGGGEYWSPCAFDPSLQ